MSRPPRVTSNEAIFGTTVRLSMRTVGALAASCLSRTTAGARSSSRAVAIFSLGVAFLLAPAGRAQSQDNALPFFTSYTITGDYNVTSVDLPPQSAPNGTVTTTLEVSGVPENADIIAAFLYWETIWSGPPNSAELLKDLKDKVRFRGEPVSGIKSSTRSLVGPFSPCWSNGGDNLTMFRADVRRLLPPQLQPFVEGDESLKPTGKRVVNHAELVQYQSDFPAGNWLLTATLPEAGNGNKLPQTGGLSLLLIYRDPDLYPAGAQILKTIVVYDGVRPHSGARRANRADDRSVPAILILEC